MADNDDIPFNRDFPLKPGVVDEARPGGHPSLKEAFARVEQVAEFKRMRGPLTIETYTLDLLQGPKREVLDRSPPPELE